MSFLFYILFPFSTMSSTFPFLKEAILFSLMCSLSFVWISLGTYEFLLVNIMDIFQTQKNLIKMILEYYFMVD